MLSRRTQKFYKGSALESPYIANAYYSQTAKLDISYPLLEGALECDVCVIGGGLTGITAALHLAEHGFEVVLLEGSRVGSGASGRNGGQLIPGYACNASKFVPDLQPSEIAELIEMGQHAVELVKARIQRHAIACDFQPGFLTVTHKRRDVARLQRFCTADPQLRWIDQPALSGFVQTSRYCGGVYDPRGGHLHPLSYTRGLAEAAVKAGVRIFEQSAVQALKFEAFNEAITSKGQVRGRFIVLAGYLFMPPLTPPLARMVMPVGTYLIATEPLGRPRAEALLPMNAAVCDSRFVLDYFRRSADHRLLWGGKVSYSTRAPSGLSEVMRKDLLKVFPQLADVRIDFAWGGLVDISRSRAPHLGRLNPTVYFAQGFSGHGLNITALSASLIAEAIAGQAKRFDLFARLRHFPFLGGRALKMPLLVLAMLYFRLRDWL